MESWTDDPVTLHDHGSSVGNAATWHSWTLWADKIAPREGSIERRRSGNRIPRAPDSTPQMIDVCAATTRNHVLPVSPARRGSAWIGVTCG